MAKYRLSYLENGGYKAIDLSKLICLKFKPTKVTDIRTIDELTMSFKSYDEFIEFLMRNKIINKKDLKLEITIDKKIEHSNESYNKPIYNSNKLLFKGDSELYNPSYILKNIKEHFFDSEYIYNLALNYEEKYKNAYNRITGSSSILGIITTIKVFALKLKSIGREMLEFDEIDQYDKALSNLFNLEVFKSNIIKDNNKITIKTKKDENGNNIKNYRGIHDFVILLKKLDPTIIKNNIEEYEEKEEYLTLKDFRKVNEEIVYSHEFNNDIYYDGINDCISDFESRQEMFRDLQRGSRKYCLRMSDSDRKQ